MPPRSWFTGGAFYAVGLVSARHVEVDPLLHPARRRGVGTRHRNALALRPAHGGADRDAVVPDHEGVIRNELSPGAAHPDLGVGILPIDGERVAGPRHRSTGVIPLDGIAASCEHRDRGNFPGLHADAEGGDSLGEAVVIADVHVAITVVIDAVVADLGRCGGRQLHHAALAVVSHLVGRAGAIVLAPGSAVADLTVVEDAVATGRGRDLAALAAIGHLVERAGAVVLAPGSAVADLAVVDVAIAAGRGIWQADRVGGAVAVRAVLLAVHVVVRVVAAEQLLRGDTGLDTVRDLDTPEAVASTRIDVADTRTRRVAGLGGLLGQRQEIHRALAGGVRGIHAPGEAEGPHERDHDRHCGRVVHRLVTHDFCSMAAAAAVW